MYGGWWLQQNGGKRRRLERNTEPSCNFNEFYVNYVFLQFFPGMLWKEWAVVVVRLGSGVFLLPPRSMLLALMAGRKGPA